jgi:hypothetical protein
VNGNQNVDQSRSNSYEDSLCQETHHPYERGFCFFSAFQDLAQSAVRRVF